MTSSLDIIKIGSANSGQPFWLLCPLKAPYLTEFTARGARKETVGLEPLAVQNRVGAGGCCKRGVTAKSQINLFLIPQPSRFYMVSKDPKP